MKTQTEKESVVKTVSLALRRGEKLLFENMNWRLPRGKFLAVTGASGAGKSSLLACLGGALVPTSGAVKLAADKKSIGCVFQNFRLTANLSVLTNVLCGRLGAYSWRQTVFSFPERERQNAFQILRQLKLETLVHRQVRQISGGEQQRAAIARALLQNPEIILADEPTSNLDADLARRVLSILRRRCAEENRTVIAVLHDGRMVEEFADYELKIGAEFENGWEMSEPFAVANGYA
ncbi:MAG: ATP-binding cassette domain-containing protein [Pyrinomonadaceae bacterium]|nr:ATP-binding cassette domain-containing protein [Pyrinomonadaceae bacterium]